MFKEGVEMATMENGKKKRINFIDFCAGIGGGRLGLEKAGMRCVGFSEIAKNYTKTYRELFGTTEPNFGDLTKIKPEDLPDFDLMIAGFPCQTFSVIGPRTGMKDRRGLVIFGLTKILLEKNIKYFILENVKGLLNHGNGESLEIILKELDAAGYKVFWMLVNSLCYGVPQSRERIYFAGARKDLVKNNVDFGFPRNAKRPDIKDYLIDTDESLEFNQKTRPYETFLKYLDNKYNKGKFSIERMLEEEYLVIDTRQSDLRLYRGRTPTLRTGRHGILYVRNGKLRRLSGYESLLLQGFPKELAQKTKGKIDENSLLSQAGNAMTVNVVEAFGKKFIDYINKAIHIEHEEKRPDKIRFANR
jgi:DNA (cytosine-5)-methyltransferase 1